MTRINPWDPWYRRAWKRAIQFVSSPDEADYGAEFAQGDYGLSAEYDPAEADSAAKVFSWVYAAVSRRASALASLPVEVYRIEKNKRVVLPDHWLTVLMERPNSYTAGHVFVQELAKDYDLSGEAAVKIIVPEGMTLSAAAKAGMVSLQRLHPKKFKVVTDRSGPIGYQYDLGGEQENLALDAVCHIRRPGFGYEPKHMFHGVGAIQSLNDELNAELNAIKRAGEAAKTGRPDCVLMPKDPQERINRPARQKIATAYSRLSKQGGALVLSGALDYQQLSYSPRDLEFSSLREMTRAGVLAALEVPPSVLGLETANYATARQQDIRFWEGIRTLASAFDVALMTRLLRLAGERDTYGNLSIEGVQALQLWQSDAIQRVTQLYMIGFDRDVAATSQGLSHVVELQNNTSSGSRKRATRAWWGDLSRVEGQNDQEWEDYIKQLHDPHERATARATHQYLSELAERVSAGIDEAWPGTEGRSLSRDDTTDILAEIFEYAKEKQLLKDAMADVIQEALEDAFSQAMTGLDLVEASRVDELVDEILGDKIVTFSLIDTPVVEITDTNRAAVRTLIRTGLEEGATIAEMQFAIQEMPEFSNVRALRIARTETTRAVNAGKIKAYDTTEDEAGVSIERTWLSAHDAATRPEHIALDGQTVGRGEKFTIPIQGNGAVSDPRYVGKQASGPGGFDDVAMVVNCRCTVIPSVKEI